MNVYVVLRFYPSRTGKWYDDVVVANVYKSEARAQRAIDDAVAGSCGQLQQGDFYISSRALIGELEN